MNTYLKNTLSLASIAFLQASTLNANTELEPVLVSANKTETSLKYTSVASEIITAEEIKQKGAVRLRDILKFKTGMFNMSQDSISIRGLNADHTLILIDGKRLTGEVGGSLELDRINISDIERIEIVKGSASGLYGTDALGGVVNIITKKSDKPSVRINPQLGTFGGDGLQKSISLSSNIPINEKFTLKLDGSFRDYERLDNEQKESIQRDGDVKFIGLGLDYKITQEDSVSFKADFMLDKGDNFMKNNMVNMKDDNERQNYSLAWNRKNSNYNSMLRVYTSLYDKTFEVHNTKQKKIMKFVKADRDTTVAEAQLNFFLSDNNLLSIGGELRREGFEGNVVKTKKPTDSGTYKGLPYQNSKIDIDYYAIFIQNQYKASDALSITGSVRYDDSSEFENSISPKVGITYSVIDKKDKGLRLKLNYSHGFKTPTPADLYRENVRHDKQLYLRGNPDLTSEKSRTFDIAFEGEYNDFSAKVSYFHADIEDLIEKVFTGKKDASSGYKLFSFENLSEATIDGVEVEAAYKFSDSMKISANYTYLDAKGDMPYGPPPKKQFKTMKLENRPDHLANIKAFYIHIPWDLRVNVWGEYVGNMLLGYEKDGALNIVAKDEKSYALLHASVTKGIGNDLVIYAGVDNISDKTDDDIPLLGVFSYIGIRYSF